MTDEILEYLSELNEDKEIWVEYGIQSVSDKTLDFINRGHDVGSMFEWIAKTKAHGLLVCTHLIFGLPDETQELMLEGVKRICDAGADSVKFHPMYVVKNTALTALYQKGQFIPITEDLYVDTIKKAFEIMPHDMVVQRVSAGIDDSSLLAPQWCRIKHKQMHRIRKALREIGLNY